MQKMALAFSVTNRDKVNPCKVTGPKTECPGVVQGTTSQMNRMKAFAATKRLPVIFSGGLTMPKKQAASNSAAAAATSEERQATQQESRNAPISALLGSRLEMDFIKRFFVWI